MTFQYYEANIKSVVPLGYISLDRWIQSMKYPKQKFKDIFKAIETAQNKAEKNKLKERLYYFTPCVTIKKRRCYAEIDSFTGLLTVDFDNLEPDYAIEFKEALFNEYKFIICTWLSSSKRGVRALIKIPISKSIEEFKQYFGAIEKKLDVYRGFDTAPKNCVLPMFMSYDPDILYRDDYQTWTRKYIEPVKPVIKQYIIDDKSDSVSRIIYSAINKITDNGHPQLRAAAYSLGGYVGAGYISENDAKSLIDKCIESNSYLSRGSGSFSMASTYKKTAHTMIEKGQQSPLYLTKNGKI